MDKTQNRINRILAEIKPYIKAHGGDVELVKIEGKTVTLEIKGACVGCPLAKLTYNKIIRGLIKEKISEVEKVVFRQSATPIRESHTNYANKLNKLS